MISGTPTRVAAVIERLETIVRAAGFEPTVQIVVGPLGAEWPQDEAVIIAPGDPDSPGVFVTYGRQPSMGNAQVEQIDVAVVLRSYSGDDDMLARIQRCALFVERIQNAVKSNMVVDGVWDRLEMGAEASWHPTRSESGVNCSVGLSLTATGLI